MAVTVTQLEQLYLAYFGRPADFNGIAFYTANSATTLADVQTAFANSAESQALYGTTPGASFVNAIYRNLFNRDADLPGLTYWTQQLVNHAFTPAQAALVILQAAKNDDALTIANKLSVAAAFTAALDTTPEVLAYSGDAAAATARAFLATVGPTADSATAATKAIDSTILALEGIGGVGQTFVLTGGIDNIVGTSGNDLILASMDNSGTPTVNTLTVGDAINGGAGTDTLKVTTASTGTVDLRSATISSVEKLLVLDSNESVGTVYLGANSFSEVTMQNTDGTVYGMNEGTTATFKALGGTGSAYHEAYFEYNATTATSVTAVDNFAGATGATNGYAEFDHGYDGSVYTGLATVTNFTSTLNATDMHSFGSDDDWVEQYIYMDNATNAGATINVNVNVTGATSDGTDYSGTDTYVYQTGDATVTANINIADSDSVEVDVYADESSNILSTVSPANVANVTLSNVSNSDFSEIYLSAFGTINLTVNAASSIDELYTYDTGGGTFKTQTLNIVANADFSVTDSSDGTDVADSGSVAVVVSGAGNVDLGMYDGTYTALSSTVTDTIDATALTGNFSVHVMSNSPMTWIKTGVGKDAVTVDSAISATEVIDLGAGDDFLNLTGAITAGATLAGGAGNDKLGMTDANWTSVSAFSATNLALISGWETLYINNSTGAAAGATYDLSKLAGLTGFQSQGVATGGTATVTNVGANATITEKGDLVTNNGTLVVTLKDATGTSDVLNFVANTKIAQNNDTTVDTTVATETLSAAGVETINFTSTGKLSATVAAGAKTDNALNTLSLTDTALKSLVITGDQSVSYTDVGATKLALVDASANTGVAAATFDVSASTKSVTVLGELGAKNTIVGSAQADTIVGGGKADIITGGAGGDTLTGGAGNDTFKYVATSDSTLLNLDTITDFHANTWGQGISATTGLADGSATAAGADATSTKLTGDLIDLTGVAGAYTTIKVGVETNASDSQTFLQNLAADATVTAGLGAALDSSSGNLYLDVDHNGTADMVIHLTGVTTLTSAAFVV